MRAGKSAPIKLSRLSYPTGQHTREVGAFTVGDTVGARVLVARTRAP